MDLADSCVPLFSDLSSLEVGGAPCSSRQPSAGAPKSSLFLPRYEPLASHPWEGCHGRALSARGGPLLLSHSSRGDVLLRAAQSSCSTGEDLALQLMAGVHTELLLRAPGTHRQGCVHSHTSEHLFCPLQTLLQAPASQLPVSSSRRENVGAEAKDS